MISTGARDFSVQNPAGRAYSVPLAGFPGPISREKGGEGKGYTSEKARSGREWKGREREREYGWAHMGGPPTQG